MKRKTMKARAKDVMYTEFNTLRPDIPISEAVRIFRKASEKEQKKVE